MVPMNVLGPDVLILIAVVLVLFGGAKLAGVGKGAGRAIREFREETSTLNGQSESREAAAEDRDRPKDN